MSVIDVVEEKHKEYGELTADARLLYIERVINDVNARRAVKLDYTIWHELFETMLQIEHDRADSKEPEITIRKIIDMATRAKSYTIMNDLAIPVIQNNIEGGSAKPILSNPIRVKFNNRSIAIVYNGDMRILSPDDEVSLISLDSNPETLKRARRYGEINREFNLGYLRQGIALGNVDYITLSNYMRADSYISNAELWQIKKRFLEYIYKPSISSFWLSREFDRNEVSDESEVSSETTKISLLGELDKQAYDELAKISLLSPAQDNVSDIAYIVDLHKEGLIITYYKMLKNVDARRDIESYKINKFREKQLRELVRNKEYKRVKELYNALGGDYDKHMKRVEAILNNKCPHVDIYKAYRRARNKQKRADLEEELLTYAEGKVVIAQLKKQEDMISCKKCKLPLVCPHLLAPEDPEFIVKGICKICYEGVKIKEIDYEVRENRSEYDRELKGDVFDELVIILRNVKFIKQYKLIDNVITNTYEKVRDESINIDKLRTESAVSVRARLRIAISIQLFAYLCYLITEQNLQLDIGDTAQYKNKKEKSVALIMNSLALIKSIQNVSLRELKGKMSSDDIKIKLVASYVYYVNEQYEYSQTDDIKYKTSYDPFQILAAARLGAKINFYNDDEKLILSKLERTEWWKQLENERLGIFGDIARIVNEPVYSVFETNLAVNKEWERFLETYNIDDLDELFVYTQSRSIDKADNAKDKLPRPADIVYGQLYDEKGEKHNFNIFILGKKEYTLKEFVESNLGEFSDRKCSVCGIRRSMKITPQYEKRCREMLRQKHKILNFFKYYEVLCPADGIHEFAGDKCKKCNLKQGTQPQEYYNKYQSVYEKQIKKEVVEPRVEKYEAKFSSKEALELYPYNLNDIVNVAAAAKVQYQQLEYFGAVNNEIPYSDILEKNVDIKSTYNQARVNAIINANRNLMIDFHQLKNYTTIIKPLPHIAELWEQFNFTAAVKLPIIHNFNELYEAIYNEVRDYKTLIEFNIAFMCKTLLNIKNFKHKQTADLRAKFVQSFIARQIEVDILRSKYERFSWTALYKETVEYEYEEKELYYDETIDEEDPFSMQAYDVDTMGEEDDDNIENIANIEGYAFN